MPLFRSVLVAALALALTLAAAIGVSPAAEAQDNDYAPTVDPLFYGGPFSNTTGEITGEPGSDRVTDESRAFHTPVIEAAEGGIGGGTEELAFTGSSSGIIATSGMVLVLAGGTAVVMSRKRND